MLLIDDALVRKTLTMAEAIDAMTSAFAELSGGQAVTHPRQRYAATMGDDHQYVANMIAGAVPSEGVAALRYDSMIAWEHQGRVEYQYPDRRSWGFVLLFGLRTGEPLALIQDFSLSGLRVGATTGVALQALAREDAATVGLFGSGNQARRNLEAVVAVRPIRGVRVFSPNRDHVRTFAREMSDQLAVPVQAVADAAEVVRGADVVMCATNSSQPVFDGHLLEAGQTVVTIANSNALRFRSEADVTTFLRSDQIVINHYPTLVANHQRELLDLLEQGQVAADKVVELGEVVRDRTIGRPRREAIVYYKNNAGLGIQFAAAGARVYRACQAHGWGQEVPSAWFGADVGEWLDQGYLPSP